MDYIQSKLHIKRGLEVSGVTSYSPDRPHSYGPLIPSIVPAAGDRTHTWQSGHCRAADESLGRGSRLDLLQWYLDTQLLVS